MYFGGPQGSKHYYDKSEMRFHAVGDGSGNTLKALTTPMRFPANNIAAESAEIHRVKIWEDANIPYVGEASQKQNNLIL